MLVHVYLACACVLSLELFLNLNFLTYVSSVGRNTKKVFRVIIAPRSSDHWKEKIVPAYAFILLKSSLSVLGILFLIIFIFLGFTVLSDHFLTLLLSVTGIVESLVISLIYLKLRDILFNE